MVLREEVSMRRGLIAALLWLGACEPADPCGEYVDYMCLCHDDDTGVDCDELSVVYASAEPEVQDECAVLLEDQQQADEEAGETCEY